MSATAKRKILNEYTDAARRLELSGVAVDVLERVGGVTAQRCIKQLKAEQHRQLKKLDRAAARLGAPYPGTTS